MQYDIIFHFMKQQSQTPTYFFVAGASQVELMNTSRLTPLRKDGKIPHDNPRFIADIFGQRVRHTIACTSILQDQHSEHSRPAIVVLWTTATHRNPHSRHTQ
jgi:hypothetical protein